MIDKNPFIPELHFLRGVAYMNRKSEFKKSDYWEAEKDFLAVQTFDPYFPGLKHYFELLDYYLYGKRRTYKGTR